MRRRERATRFIEGERGNENEGSMLEFVSEGESSTSQNPGLESEGCEAMKAKILLDPERPKVSYEDAKKVILSTGIEVSEQNADVGVVIGGDGVFGEFGRSESIPLLLVGVRSRGATGSKAYLATADFEDLASVMGEVKKGRYEVVQFRRLEVTKNGKPLGDVFTDVYVERGADSNCIRYHLKVKGTGLAIFESAIGDGVVITTRAGSTGYFSYETS